MNKIPFFLRLFNAVYFRLVRGTLFFPKFLSYKGVKLGYMVGGLQNHFHRFF